VGHIDGLMHVILEFMPDSELNAWMLG